MNLNFERKVNTMAKAMVTRTILTTDATVMCVNTEEQTCFNETFSIPRTYKKDADILKAVAPLLPEGVVAVHVIETDIKETLYGMEEAKFIANAEILPTRVKKEG